MKKLELEFASDRITPSEIDLDKHIVIYNKKYVLSKCERPEIERKYDGKYMWFKLSNWCFANGLFDSIEEAIRKVPESKVEVFLK